MPDNRLFVYLLSVWLAMDCIAGECKRSQQYLDIVSLIKFVQNLCVCQSEVRSTSLSDNSSLNLPTFSHTSTFKLLNSGTLTTDSIIPVLDYSLLLEFWLVEEVSLLLLVIVGTSKWGVSCNKSLIFVSMF